MVTVAVLTPELVGLKRTVKFVEDPEAIGSVDGCAWIWKCVSSESVT